MTVNRTFPEAALATLLRHDGAAPRYTSYPPANFFTESPDAADWRAMLAESNGSGPRDISFYFHVPFCPRRCLFCGCHTEIGRSGAFIREYMDTLPMEFGLLAPHLDRERPVTQIHFGGGTPNFVPYSHLEEILKLVSSTFLLAEHAEVAMECDPALVLRPQLEQLRGMGFNRISFGIQDVNPRVLQAVDRRPSRLAPGALVATARDLGFTGINLDLIYGLPFQTRESFAETVRVIAEASPDRISLFPYAHVPWIKDHQTALEPLPAPNAEERLRIALESRDILLDAGYEAIGMDHFARPDDELARSKRAGTLRRNFQGYAPDNTGQVHALGASAISQVHAGYLQNEKDTTRYQAKVRAGELPFTGAYRMRPQDVAARDIINSLLCSGHADVNTLPDLPGLSPEWKATYWIESLERLAPYLKDGLAKEEGGTVRVTETGFPLTRRIAAAFDPLSPVSTARHSRAL